MARPKSDPRPFWRGREQSWYAKVGGRTLSLRIRDPHARAAAVEALHKILQDLEDTAEAPQDPRFYKPGPTVSAAVENFLSDADRRAAAGKIRPKTAKDYRFPLNALAADLGDRPLASLTAAQLEAWAARPGWSMSTRSGYLAAVSTLLARNKVALDPPLAIPRKKSRGRSCSLTPEQWAKVVAAVRAGDYPGDFLEYLTVLRLTGARPGEIAPLTAEAVDWRNGCAVLEEHKTAHRTGEPLLKVFTAAAMAVLEGQRAKYGSGLLFRTRYGKQYTRAAVVRRCAAISKRVGFRVIAYGCRHSFASEALANGASDVLVAELLGHKGTNMVHHHYKHLGNHVAALRAAAEKATGRQAG